MLENLNIDHRAIQADLLVEDERQGMIIELKKSQFDLHLSNSSGWRQGYHRLQGPRGQRSPGGSERKWMTFVNAYRKLTNQRALF